MQTPEGFRRLAELLRSSENPAPADEKAAEPEDRLQPDDEDAARDLRLFRARIAEAVECAVETLCEDIAAEVVGRELQLAPPEIETIVRRALERYAAEGITRVRAHPEDAAKLSHDLAYADPSLRRGDVLLEVASGSVDASLGVRLASVLRALR